MNVPFIDLKRHHSAIRDEVISSWKRCFDNTEYVGGPSVDQFEQELEKHTRVNHAVSCANGTDALILGLQALGLDRGAKIALPNLTFWATFEAVYNLGMEPILIDIDPEDLQMSFREFERAHQAFGLDGAILVHLYGWASKDTQQFRDFCSKKGIKLLEDGAQAFGVQVDGESIFKGAQAATLSFYPAKVLGGAMDGGAVVTATPETAQLIKVLRNHGRANHYSYSHSGWNSRMSGINAAFLLIQLKTIQEQLHSRIEAVNYYRAQLSGLTEHLDIYAAPQNIKENGYLNVLRVKRSLADSIGEKLKTQGIGFGRTYPETIDTQPQAKNAKRISDLMISREFCKKVINLPVFSGITRDELNSSTNALKSVLASL